MHVGMVADDYKQVTPVDVIEYIGENYYADKVPIS
jgi:hypothetical protein